MLDPSIAGAIEAPDIEGVAIEGVVMDAPDIEALSIPGTLAAAPDIEAEAAGASKPGIAAEEEDDSPPAGASPKPESIFREGESVPILSADIF